MSKFPSAYSVYNLSENFMATIEDTFRGTGDDNSLTNSKIIHIGSAPLGRIIAFTAFIESYKINLQKEIQEDRAASSTTTYFTDVNGNLSISLSLNIPAHSTNEAVNNVAKIEELQRLNILGALDKDNVNKIAKTTVPVMIVHFANLISNSRNVGINFEINSFTDLVQKGFPCYIESISYEPQTDSGFFEFDSFLYPKNIKLKLELKYESQKLYGSDDPNRNKTTLRSFGFDSAFYTSLVSAKTDTAKAIYTRPDDGMFPFHSDGIKHYNKAWKKMSVKTMNDLSLQNFGENKKYFLFISIAAKNDEDLNGMIKGANNNKDFLSSDVFLKYVMFEAAVTSFSRNLNLLSKVGASDEATPNTSIHSDLKSLIFKSLDYSINIDVVSSSLAEAYQNCAKIQYLTRIFLKKSQATSDKEDSPITELDKASSVKVYAPSFIESGKGGKAIATDLETICTTKSVDLQFVDFQMDIDMSSGFYEDRGRMLPKKMTLTMAFKTGKDGYMRGYNLDSSPAGDTWNINVPSTGSTVYDAGGGYLFPYNRKTVKIGGE
jgi:hypothetical protein